MTAIYRASGKINHGWRIGFTSIGIDDDRLRVGVQVTIKELRQLAVSVAHNYGLDPALVQAVCENESSWYPWASRYEPGFYARYIENNPQLGNLTLTEKQARAFSYGLMQVMGQVAREQRFGAKSLLELCDPLTNLNQGCTKLKRCMDDAVSVREGLLKYNGGADLAYPDRVLKLMDKYKGVA